MNDMEALRVEIYSQYDKEEYAGSFTNDNPVYGKGCYIDSQVDISALVNQLADTKYGKYTSKSDKYTFTIDWNEYVQDVAENAGYKVKELSEEEKSQYYIEDAAFYVKYSYQVIDNIICFKAADGSIASSPYYVMITKDKEFTDAMEAAGLGSVIEVMREHEDNILARAMEGGLTASLYYSATVANCSVDNSDMLYISYMQPLVYADAKYIADMYSDDIWCVQNSAAEESYDALAYSAAYMIEQNYYSYRLAVYGDGSNIKELVLYNDSSTVYNGKLTKAAYPTVIKYLVALGASPEEAEELISKLPDTSGSLGAISYYTEQHGTIVKFYVE